MNNIDAKITAWQLGPVTIMHRLAARPRHHHARHRHARP